MSTYIVKRAKKFGLKMVDAEESAWIEVTAGDIRLANQKNSKSCAFARAAKRLGARAAFFFKSTAWIEVDDQLIRYTLQKAAAEQVRQFDKDGSMVPGVYVLAKPTPGRTRHHMKKTDRKRAQKRKEREQKRRHKVAGAPARPLQHSTSNLRLRDTDDL